MKDIYIDKVSLKNVRCHYEMEMDFPVDSLTIIVGKNGKGKSTIFKAVSMALFGDDGSKEGERASLEEMINKKVGKDLEIFLWFRIVENDRTDRYEIRVYGNHRQYHNKMFLFKNDIDISGKSKTETYAFIENILVPRDVYHNIVYFNQQVKDFFTCLTNSKQKEIFNAILSLKEFSEYYKNSDSVLKSLSEDLTEIINDIALSENTQKEKRNSLLSLQDLKKKAELEYQVEKARLLSQIVTIQNNIQVNEEKLSDLNFDEEKLINLRSELTKTESQKASLEKDKLEKAISFDKEQMKILENALLAIRSKSDLKISGEREKTSNDIHTINNEIQKIMFAMTTVSKKYDTTALQQAIDSFKKEKNQEISFLLKEIEGCQEKFPTQDLEDQKKKRLKKIQDSIDSIKQRSDDVKMDASQIKKDIEKLQIDIDTDRAGLDAHIAICSKCRQPLNSEHKATIEADIKKNTDQLEEKKKQLEDLKIKFSDIKKEYESDSQLLQTESQNFDNMISEVLTKKSNEIQNLKHKISLLEQEMSYYESDIVQKIAEIKKNESKETGSLQAEIDRLNESIISSRTSLQNLINSIQEQTDNDVLFFETEHNKNVSAQRKLLIDEVSFKIEDLETSIMALELAIESIKADERCHEELKTAISSLKATLESLNDQHSQLTVKTVDTTSIVKTEKEISDLDDHISKKKLEKVKKEKEISGVQFWKVGFSDAGMKSMLIDMAIPHMNEIVSSDLERIAPGMFTVSFDTLKQTKGGDFKDKFSVNILHNIKGTDSHKLLSGGEKRLVDLACMSALRSLSEKLYQKIFHNVFYDEVLDSLDEDSCASFCQVSKLLSTGRNVTLITHNALESVEPDRLFTL